MPNDFRVEIYTITVLIISWLIKEHFDLSMKMYIGLVTLMLVMVFQKLW